MGIKDLRLKPGLGFRFRGPRSVASRLKNAAKYGEFKNLSSENQATIIRELEKRKASLRFRGGLSLSERRSAICGVLKDKETTLQDKRDAKKIFNALARGAAAKEKKPAEEETSVKVSDGGNLTRKQVERLRFNAQKAGGFRGRQSGEVQFGGGKALVTSIGVAADRSVPGAGHIGGNAKELGIKEQTAGFAIQKVNNTKPTGSPSPEAPSKGSRPIGL